MSDRKNEDTIVARLSDAVRYAYGPKVERRLTIPLHMPFELEDMLPRAAEMVVMSDYTKTTLVRLFEEKLAERCGVPFAVSTNTGTAALQLALRAVMALDREASVTMPPSAFVAAANAASYLNASVLFQNTPRQTFSAHVFSHLWGLPDPAMSIQTAPPGIGYVEDAAQALGTTVAGFQLGSYFGDVGVLSFNTNKIITTMGGGAIITSNYDIAEACRHWGSTARLPGPGFEYDEVGYNFRMSPLAAALGILQLKALDTILEIKAERYERYKAAIPDMLPDIPASVSWNHWVVPARVPMPGLDIGYIVQRLQDGGIMARPAFRPLPDTGAYGRSPSSRPDLEAARAAFVTTIVLPNGA